MLLPPAIFSLYLLLPPLRPNRTDQYINLSQDDDEVDSTQMFKQATSEQADERTKVRSIHVKIIAPSNAIMTKYYH
jgi:hypothetical protein